MEGPSHSFDAVGAPRSPAAAAKRAGVEHHRDPSDVTTTPPAASTTPPRREPGTDGFDSHMPSPADKESAFTRRSRRAAAEEGDEPTAATAAEADGDDSEERSTRAVNTAYSRRVMIAGDRALVVHFTHNPNSALSASEQLLTVARVAIPALCNYLYFRAGKLAVVYLGKSRTSSGLKTGIVGGDDMKMKILRYLTSEIWPPLRTDVPDDSGAAREESASGESQSTNPSPDTLETVAPHAAPKAHVPAAPSYGDVTSPLTPAARQTTASGLLSVCSLNGNPMQVLVYLKEGASGTKYIKLVIANIEKLHFDVVDTREEKYRWENRKLHIRMLDSLETQKAIYSYAEYEQALRDACTFALQHRDEVAEDVIAECAACDVDVDVADFDDTVSTSPSMAATPAPAPTPSLTLPRIHGNATTSLLYAQKQSSTISRPVSPAVSAARSTTPSGGAREGVSPSIRSLNRPPALAGFTLGPSAIDSSAGLSSPGPQHGQVHCVIVKDHFYKFYQPMSLPESATLDYKSYFFNTAKEINDRAVKFMCGFLNAYGHGKLVVGVHEIRGAVSNTGKEAATPLTKEATQRTVPEQLVVGAHLSLEEINALVSDLSVQLAHCVPPVPAEIVHINLVPVRLPAVPSVPPMTSPTTAVMSPESGDAFATSPGARIATSLPTESVLDADLSPTVHSPPMVSPTTAPPAQAGKQEGGRSSGHFPVADLDVPPPASPSTAADAPTPPPRSASAAPGAAVATPPRQRVLVFYEPPAANYFNVFQQKANFAVRALARHGYSLVPLDLPLPRLTTDAAKPGGDRSLVSNPAFDRSLREGPLHGVVYPIPRDWIAQCYAIVPFAPDAAAQAAIFEAESTARDKEGPTTSSEAAFGTQDVVEVFDGTIWTPYDEDSSRIVTLAKAKKEKKATIKVSKRIYELDLEAMTQVNVRTKTVRPIRIRHFGSVADFNDGLRDTLANHEFEVLRGLNMQKSARQCIVWAEGVPLPELYIIDVSVDIRRLPDSHPLRYFKGKFFNGWPSIPLWDPLSHCVRRAPRTYTLVTQRRHHIDGLLPDAEREWNQRIEVCMVVAVFADAAGQRALRLVNRAFSDAIDSAWGRDVVRTMVDDSAALMRDLIVPVPFDALRATQYALRREFGAGDPAVLALAHKYQALHGGASTSTNRSSKRRRHGAAALRRGPSTLPLIVCWVYEALGAIPAPFPHVPVPLQLQSVRLAPHLVTLYMTSLHDDSPWALVPSLVLDLSDGLLKFFPSGSQLPASPTGPRFGGAAAMVEMDMMSRTDSNGSTTAGSTPNSIIDNLRIVCGAMCDAYSAAKALESMLLHVAMKASLSNRQGTPPLAPKTRHHSGSVAPVKLLFVDATASHNPSPWTVQSLLVWLQLVAKDPNIRHHGAPTSGSTMALMCDLVHEACAPHLQSPVVQSHIPRGTHPADMGSRVSSSLLVTPQPAPSACFPGGSNAWDNMPSVTVEPASPPQHRDATAPSLDARRLSTDSLATAMPALAPSPMKRGKTHEFPAAPALEGSSVASPSTVLHRVAAQPAPSGRHTGPSESPVTTSNRFYASTFDCPLHRAEAEWAMW